MATKSINPVPRIELLLANSEALFEAARALFCEYAENLSTDLCFQSFENELADLPGMYAAPLGTLLIAMVDNDFAGCCALRPLDNTDYANSAELKRLYIRPAFRGFGLGRQLSERVLDFARTAGYKHVLLDTLDEMEAARTLYAELGFEEIPPYYHNPIAGAHYLKVAL